MSARHHVPHDGCICEYLRSVSDDTLAGAIACVARESERRWPGSRGTPLDLEDLMQMSKDEIIAALLPTAVGPQGRAQ